MYIKYPIISVADMGIVFPSPQYPGNLPAIVTESIHHLPALGIGAEETCIIDKKGC